MPIILFGNGFGNTEKTDASSFVEKPHLRINFIECNLEQKIDLNFILHLGNYKTPIASEKLFQFNMMLISSTIPKN